MTGRRVASIVVTSQRCGVKPVPVDRFTLQEWFASRHMNHSAVETISRSPEGKIDPRSPVNPPGMSESLDAKVN